MVTSQRHQCRLQDLWRGFGELTAARSTSRRSSPAAARPGLRQPPVNGGDIQHRIARVLEIETLRQMPVDSQMRKGARLLDRAGKGLADEPRLLCCSGCKWRRVFTCARSSTRHSAGKWYYRTSGPDDGIHPSPAG